MKGIHQAKRKRPQIEVQNWRDRKEWKGKYKLVDKYKLILVFKITVTMTCMV